MDVTLTDSLMLVAVLALLMVNYATRRIATAQSSRAFVKDHIKHVRHHNHSKIMLDLRERLTLIASTLVFTALGALLGLVAAGLVLFDIQLAAKVAFVAGIVSGAIGLLQSLRESRKANKSIFSELDYTVSKDEPYRGTGAP